MRPTLVLTIALAAGTAACATAGPEIRMIERPLQSGHLAAADRIAEGNAMMRLGNVGLAIEAYRRARRTDPANPDVHVMLASAYDRMGRLDLAATHYEEAMALAPHRPDLYVALAHVLSRANRPDDARALLDEADRRRAMLDVPIDATMDGSRERLALQIDEQQARTRQIAQTQRIAPPPPRQSGPHLAPAGPGITRLVTRDAPIWPERDDRAPAIAVAALQPPDRREPEHIVAEVKSSTNEDTHVVAVTAAGPSAVASLVSAPPDDAGRHGPRSEPAADEEGPAYARLLETITLDDEAIAMLLDEGWLEIGEVAELRRAQTARSATMPLHRGVVWCSK